jgi:hypothetical protein
MRIYDFFLLRIMSQCGGMMYRDEIESEFKSTFNARIARYAMREAIANCLTENYICKLEDDRYYMTSRGHDAIKSLH